MKTPFYSLFFLTFFTFSLNSQTLNLDFPSVNGQVYTLAAKGDTLFIGGDFIEVAEIPRSNLAAIDLLTGSLLDWNPETDGKVDCIKVYKDVVYVCGEFQIINETPRNTLAAIDANDGTLTNWNPEIIFPGIPNMQLGRVSGLDATNDNIYIGGYFLSVNGDDKTNLAALDLQGNLQSWNPSLDIPLEKVVIRDNLLYISGPFTQVNGQERKSFASFELPGGNLTNWNPQADNPGNSGTVLFPQDDHVFVAGFFTNIGGEIREHAAKVNSVTGEVLPWEVSFFNAFPFVTSFERWGDQLFMGGSFVLQHNIPLDNLVAVDAETGEYAGWWADPDNTVNSLLITQNKVIVGGNFTHISDQNKIGLAVYDLDPINAVEEIQNFEIIVFPKPAFDEITLRHSSGLVKYVELYDINGILVRKIESKGEKRVSLALNTLISGIYGLVLRSGDHSVLWSEIIPVLKR